METSKNKIHYIGGLREYYYSAVSVRVYHTCSNCSEGGKIDAEYIRRTYFPNVHMVKCSICRSLEDSGQGIPGVINSGNGRAQESYQTVHQDENL